MKIIVMGTGPFAVPTFRWLVNSEHQVDLVVTRPIDDAGRRRKSVANPVHEFAESLAGVEIFAPKSINEPTAIEKLASVDADLLFVCDFGQILKRAALATTRLGGINLHGSLLPKYRGAAPINWAVYHGEKETGVTVIHMTPRLDGGPCLASASLPIADEETAETLEPKMAQLGVKAVADSIAMLQAWDGDSDIGTLQDQSLVTQAPRLQKQQGNIDWTDSAQQLFNQVRAFQPWPGSFTHWMPASGKPLRLIVHRAFWFEADAGATAGTVLSADEAGIRIACGQGTLALLVVQPAGKKPMAIDEFLRGRRVHAGDQFGSP